MKAKALCFLGVLIVSFQVHASWKVTSNYTESKGKTISVLKFKNKSHKVTYRPKLPPYGFVDSSKIYVDQLKREIFITSWANSAQTLQYKIFDPEVSGATPLCEEISFSDEPLKSRFRKNALEIKVKDLKSFKWKKCPVQARARINTK